MGPPEVLETIAVLYPYPGLAELRGASRPWGLAGWRVGSWRLFPGGASDGSARLARGACAERRRGSRLCVRRTGSACGGVGGATWQGADAGAVGRAADCVLTAARLGAGCCSRAGVACRVRCLIGACSTGLSGGPVVAPVRCAAMTCGSSARAAAGLLAMSQAASSLSASCPMLRRQRRFISRGSPLWGSTPELVSNGMRTSRIISCDVLALGCVIATSGVTAQSARPARKPEVRAYMVARARA